jgi:hypothetical protein
LEPVASIPVCRDLSLDDFERQFRRRNLPVVLRGEPEVASLAALRRDFGTAPLPKAVDVSTSQRVQFDSVRHYLDELEVGAKPHYYLQMRCMFPIDGNRATPLTPWWTSIKAPRYQLGKLIARSAWIGNAYIGFGLHRDECKEQFLCQVSGTKRVLMIASSFAQTRAVYPFRSFQWGFRSQVFNPAEPDLAKFPRFKDAKVFAAELERGDILFIPKSWWHDLQPNGGLNASIGFRHNCDHWKRERMRLRLQILLAARPTGDSKYWYRSARDPSEERLKWVKATRFEKGV